MDQKMIQDRLNILKVDDQQKIADKFDELNPRLRKQKILANTVRHAFVCLRQAQCHVLGVLERHIY